MAATLIRTDTPMNVLAGLALTALQGISHRKNAAYITTPQTVKRLWEQGDFLGMPCPIIALSAFSWECAPKGAGRLDGTLLFHVHCMVESKGGDPEGDLLKLVSDVMLAMLADVTLGSQAIYIFPRSFEPNVELIARTGFAVTTVTFECLHRFDSTAP